MIWFLVLFAVLFALGVAWCLCLLFSFLFTTRIRMLLPLLQVCCGLFGDLVLLNANNQQLCCSFIYYNFLFLILVYCSCFYFISMYYLMVVKVKKEKNTNRFKNLDVSRVLLFPFYIWFLFCHKFIQQVGNIS